MCEDDDGDERRRRKQGKMRRERSDTSVWILWITISATCITDNYSFLAKVRLEGPIFPPSLTLLKTSPYLHLLFFLVVLC